MKHIVAFSGGKDSTALLLWAKERGLTFTAVFCDTGWEHPLTMAYIEEINQKVLGGGLVILRSVQYAGMEALVAMKGRVPSAKARFCTEHLKIKPMVTWLATQEVEVTVYQGIRADESTSRGLLPLREWSSVYDAWVERPLLRWTAQDCFAVIKKHGLEPNPLYRLGAGRVGCFPCVMVNHSEMKRVSLTLPEVWDRAEVLERAAKGRSFFPPNYIPTRFQTGHDPTSGKSYPTVADVRSYLATANMGLFDREAVPTCLSIYNLCE